MDIGTLVRPIGFATLLIAHYGNASAQQSSPNGEGLTETLAKCLIDGTTKADKDAFRAFMIAALQENRSEANAKLLAFGFLLIGRATTACNLAFSDVESTGVQAAMEAYGEYLGELVMNEAFANAGIK